MGATCLVGTNYDVKSGRQEASQDAKTTSKSACVELAPSTLRGTQPCLKNALLKKSLGQVKAKVVRNKVVVPTELLQLRSAPTQSTTAMLDRLACRYQELKSLQSELQELKEDMPFVSCATPQTPVQRPSPLSVLALRSPTEAAVARLTCRGVSKYSAAPVRTCWM